MDTLGSPVGLCATGGYIKLKGGVVWPGCIGLAAYAINADNDLGVTSGPFGKPFMCKGLV